MSQRTRHARLIFLASGALLLLLCAAATGLAATSRIDKLVSSMSPEEKVGQLFMVWFAGPTLSPDLAELIAKRHLGGVIYYDKPGNIVSPQQVADLGASIQGAAAATRHGIGLLIGVDQEGGPVARLRDGFTVFPSQMAQAAAGRPQLVRQAALATARQLAAVGINTDFAPVADVNVNPENPVIGIRSFGQSPEQVSRLTAAATAGYVAGGVICTPKHFPGHGDTAVDSHVGLPRVDHDRKTLNRVDFSPFRASFAAGAPAVMTAHVLLPAIEPDGLPATLSRRVLGGILRQQLGFDGVIFSDSLGMGAVAATYGTPEAAVRALLAGADVLLIGADAGRPAEERGQAMDAVLDAVRTGRVSQAVLDAAVTRVLRLKRDYGLLRAKALATPRPDAVRAGTRPDDLALARHIAQRSLTAFGPVHTVLPLPRTTRTLVVRPRLGREAVDVAAEKSLRGWLETDTLFTEADPDQATIAAAVAQAGKVARVVVLVTSALAHPDQRRLVSALAEAAPGRLLVVAAQSPYDLTVLPTNLPRLAMYGEAAVSLDALAKTLFNPFHPRGRCPVILTPPKPANPS